jgi:hypothetical protein
VILGIYWDFNLDSGVTECPIEVVDVKTNVRSGEAKLPKFAWWQSPHT